MFKIKTRRVSLGIYAVLLAAALVWISFCGGPLPYMTFYTMLCLPAASCVYLGIVSNTIRFHQEIPVHKLTKGEQAPYQLRIGNAGILPFVRVTLRMETTLADLHDVSEEEVIALKPGEWWELKTDIFCRYAGTYYIGLKDYCVEDCFHFLGMRRAVPVPFRVIVRPRIPEDDRLPELDTFRNMMEMQNVSLTEAAPGNDLREYRPGDSIRRIHWKNSARMQKLLIRLPEPRELQLIQVVMIPAPQGQELSFVIRRDLFLELAVSIAYYFCTQKKMAVFYYPNGSMQKKVVDSYESFWEFYENLPDEIRHMDAMDESSWNAWIDGNCMEGGRVILLNENKAVEDFLCVCDRE